MRVSEHPSIYLPLARWKHRDSWVESRVVAPNTDMVIDGFEGSGNTFAVTAFKLAQPEPVRLVHNLHAGAQLIAATRLLIPTLVVVRDPEESVLSHVIRHPGVRLDRALHHWIRYHELAWGCRERLVFADFATVTVDFGSVIRTVNARFGTQFAEFEHSPENVARCFQIIEERNRRSHGRIDPSTVPRPSSQRADMKQALRAKLDDRVAATLRSRAQRMYREIGRGEPPDIVRIPESVSAGPPSSSLSVPGD